MEPFQVLLVKYLSVTLCLCNRLT